MDWNLDEEIMFMWYIGLYFNLSLYIGNIGLLSYGDVLIVILTYCFINYIRYWLNK